MDSLERLQGLHADLQAFTETRLANIDRLWQELDESVQEFQKLLDKPTPSTSDKTDYTAGKISVGEQEYGVSDEFRHLSRAVGTALDLDEIEAGRLLIEGSFSQVQDDSHMFVDAISRFHDSRDLLLQNLRIVLEQSFNLDWEDDVRLPFREVVVRVLNTRNGPPSNGSQFALRCVTAMEDVEGWLVKINEQIQSKALLSQMRGPEFYATLEFQRSSLFKQHEALGCILALLFRANYTTSEDVRKLLGVTKRWQRLDLLCVHYLPAFSAAFRQHGSSDGSASQDEAKNLSRAVSSLTADAGATQSRPLLAILELWWTAEYSAWSRDATTTDDDAEKRGRTIKHALDEHALETLLSMCSSMHSEMWRHPARQELIALLIRNTSGISIENDQQTSSFFYKMMMESIENFAEAWITNMPDSIRQLKSKEDDERLSQLTSSQDHIASQRDRVVNMHLESFLVLTAFAFESRPDAADQFWEDPDGNFYGFLQWSSKRQTVPRVSAFCELLCAISEGPEHAAAAHKFLLDESIVVPTSRIRRIPSMNYNQIFAELELYARRVHEKPSSSQSQKNQKHVPELNEIESPVMLSCYLRLLIHMSRHYEPTREHIFNNAGFDFPRVVLVLASGPVPSYLRATIFRTIEALLTDKTDPISNEMWKALDDWASSSHDLKMAAKQDKPPEQNLASLQATLASIASSFDQYDAFVDLLRALVAPVSTSGSITVSLPFSSDLASAYRSPGIAPYVDFVCGQVFSKRIRELTDETQAMQCAYHCLDFIAISLENFNEDYVAMLDKNATQQQNLAVPKHDLVYAQCHPFARIMQWIFGAEMNKVLLNSVHDHTDAMDSALPEAPVMLTMMRSIDVINMVLNLQPTYFDLVRPMLKESDDLRGVAFTGFSSMEESVAARSEIVLDLCHLVVNPHLPLAIRSLALLQKLTGSSKLNHHLVATSRGQPRRLIDMLGPNSDSTLSQIATTLTSRFRIDIRELEEGFEAPGYLMKDGSLAFLNACLEMQTEMPSIAHLLLGFGRINEVLTMATSMELGNSLFNAIANLVIEFPDGRDGEMVSWLVHVKAAGFRVLQHLWTAPVSAQITLSQLRRIGFLSAEFASQTLASQSTIWDGNSLSDPSFWFTTSAEALTEFFSLRACLYAYAAQEIECLAGEKTISLQRQLLQTLQGKSVLSDGAVQQHLTIFDLFDFADLDTSTTLGMPDLFYFTKFDPEVYKTGATSEVAGLYDINVVRETLQLAQGQIVDQTLSTSAPRLVEEDALSLEIDSIIGRLQARNRWTLAHKARSEALHNYVDMIVSAVENVAIEAASKTQFILHILQVILPKLDVFVAEEAVEALQLSRAADALLHVLSRQSKTSGHAHIDDIIAERLFQIFRVCLEGIPTSNNNVDLRTLLYSICSQYLNRITKSEISSGDPYRKARGNSMDCVRSASQSLVTIIADDAEDASDVCRLNALNLLGMLATLALSEKSSIIVDALVKNNVIEIMLEPIRSVVADFASTSARNRPFLLNVFEMRAFLLLQISRTRAGATALLESGLMQSYRDSMIFRADPDLGMDLDSPETSNIPQSLKASGSKLGAETLSNRSTALHNYFVLLSATLRVLLSTFSSRGPENEQINYQIRLFLSDHRANMVGVFKKAAGVGGVTQDTRTKSLIDECVKCYTGLAVGCDFLDFENESTLGGTNGDNTFT